MSAQPPNPNTLLSLTNVDPETPITSTNNTVAVLYDQTSNPGTNGVPSQYFPDFNGGAYGADDFIVPNGEVWVIETIFVNGNYSSAAAPAFGVDIYSDDNNLPGTLLYSATDIVPTSDASGDVTLNLDIPAELLPGTYWVSVWANLSFNGMNQWFWTVRTVPNNTPYAWEDRDGLFNVTACATWGYGATDCGVGGGTAPDTLFRLEGYTAPASIWDGEGIDNLWSTGANWVGDTVPQPSSFVIWFFRDSRG